MSDNPDDEQNTLRRFGVETNEHKVPKVHREVIVWSPTDDDIPVGFVGRDRRRGLDVYTTRRKPYHFYREGEGWAISWEILDRLRQTGISRILVHLAEDYENYPGEANPGDVLEFTTREYVEFGQPVPKDNLIDESDSQRYVPQSEARNRWPELGGGMFTEEFGSAMDRITSKRGWD